MNSKKIACGHLAGSPIPDDTDRLRHLNEYFLPKQNTSRKRVEYLWTKHSKTETSEDFWRKLIEIEKKCILKSITDEDFMISTIIMVATITDKNLLSNL